MLDFSGRLLRSAPGTATSPLSVVAWWEWRRLPFNAAVGIAGFLATGDMVATAIICERLIGVPIGLPDPAVLALFGIAAFAIMANVCYTGGSLIEILVTFQRMQRVDRLGPTLFVIGLVFSLLLTISPAVLCSATASHSLFTTPLPGPSVYLRYLVLLLPLPCLIFVLALSLVLLAPVLSARLWPPDAS